MKTEVLCGQCIIILRNAYDITERGRREKITCGNCGKRRYGCKCDIDPIAKRKTNNR